MSQASQTSPGSRQHSETRCESVDLAEIPTVVPKNGRNPSCQQGTAWNQRKRQQRNKQVAAENIRRTTDEGEARRPRRSLKWVDEDYYESNPWHGQAGQKLVFSLGGPFPRTVRWNKTRKPSKNPPRAAKSKEELAELGEMPSEESLSPEIENYDTQRSKPRRTAGGVSHGDKYNDAGQPVFDYVPSNDVRRQSTTQTNNTRDKEDGPDFGIDSEPLGQREHEEVEDNVDPNIYRNWWARVRVKHPEPLAEFLATFVAVFLGLASTLSVNLSANQPEKYGTYETSCWAWGFAWMFGIYLGGGISGAHMNPAISFSLSLFRGFPWRQCGIYVIAQFLASLTAGALAYGVYRDTIRYVDPTMGDTAKTFFSSPPEWASMGTACFNQLVGSAVMTIAVFALGDDQNNPPGAGMHAFVLGLLVTTLKFTLGYNIGSALNPASDFGPRIIAYAVGYREANVFGTGWWLYGPWLSTLVGSVVGCSVYDGFVFIGSENPINYRILSSPRPGHEKF
ncbi:aquaporin-like protein [Xylariaceae sp. FL1651]|nr:aquaporin-like protein [Xylariaceae sp. FL1651]